MRKEYIVIHCSASDNKDHDNIDTIGRWHLDKGWRDVGYQYFIRKDGTIEKGRDEEEPGAHCPYAVNGGSLNSIGIGICLHGLEKDKFTAEQFEACADLIKDIMKRWDIKAIVPHNMFSNRTCPVFNVVQEIYPRLYEARFKK